MDHGEFCKFVFTNLRHNLTPDKLGVVPNLITAHTEKHRAGTDSQFKTVDLPAGVSETQAGNARAYLCSSWNLLLESAWANSKRPELKLTCNASLLCRSPLWPNSYVSASRHWSIICSLGSSLSTHHLPQCGSSKGRIIFLSQCMNFRKHIFSSKAILKSHCDYKEQKMPT